jgi:hypothetical protein
MRARTYFAVLLACAIASPAFAGDLTIVSKTTSTGPMARSGTSTMYMTAGKMLMQQDQSNVLVDLASGTFTFIDPVKKQYWTMTKEDMEAMTKAMSAKMAEMQKDPRAAAMMQNMMGTLGTAKLEAGTQTKTIAGYTCSQYTLTMGETMKMVYWTTTALQPPFSAEELFNAESGMLRANPMFSRMSSLFDEMKKMKGVPLSTSTTMSMGPMQVENSSEATEVRTSAIPASTFDIPKDFKKVDSPMSKMLKP